VSEPLFSGRTLGRFVECTSLELGASQFDSMLALSQLPPQWIGPQVFLKMDAIESAKAYASLQAAMRMYFGRGARGVLLRVGQRLWGHLLAGAGLGGKTQAAVIKRLPLNARRKPTLELLARLLGAAPGDITVHTLDLDLLLADHASPTTASSHADSPICFVTQGLIGESLYWATGANYDVEETSCKACGENACEFKIITGK
jgi:predicted hydrocarbon binding protein